MSKKKENVLPELEKALEMRLQENDLYGLVASYAHLSSYYENLNSKTALSYASKMYDVAMNQKSTQDQLEALQKLIALGNPEKAKEYMKLHDEMTAIKKTRGLEDAEKQKDRVIFDTSDSDVLVFSKILVRLCVRGRALYLDNQQLDKAETLFKNSEDIFHESITIAPETADMYRECAEMYVTTGKNLSEALSLAQKALELEASAENYFVLGQAYYKNSDLQSALWALEQALKREPQNRAIRKTYNAIMEMTY